MIQRSDDLTWGLPGGHVELGETWSQAAVVAFVNVAELRDPMFAADVPVFEAFVSRRKGPFID